MKSFYKFIKFIDEIIEIFTFMMKCLWKNRSQDVKPYELDSFISFINSVFSCSCCCFSSLPASYSHCQFVWIVFFFISQLIYETSLTYSRTGEKISIWMWSIQRIWFLLSNHIVTNHSILQYSTAYTSINSNQTRHHQF